MTRVDLTADAERDLIDIYLYSAEQFGPTQAERYSEGLNAGIAFVAERHTVGSDYSNIRATLRRFKCVSHAIYDQPVKNGIRVLRLLHSRMGPVRHLTCSWRLNSAHSALRKSNVVRFPEPVLSGNS